MMKHLLPFAALLLLTGCLTDEELLRERRAADHETCMEYGFQPGSDGYANCRMRVDRKRQAREDEREREREEREAEDERRLARRLVNNGQCDDPRYRTSNGGRAKAGADEADCRRRGLGDGLK